MSREIQVALNGHSYDPRRDAVEQRFYYPIYVVFLMAPTIRLPLPVVKKIFSGFLLLLTALSVPLWLHMLQWRLSPLHCLAAMTLSVASIPALQGIYLQNLGLLVSALMAAGCATVFAGRLRFAGPLLAFATIKPPFVLPLAACLFIWSTGNWKERQQLVWSFVGSMLVLVLAGEVVLYGWITRCLRAMLLYPEKSYGVSPLQLVFTRPLGALLAPLVMGLVLYLAWRMRREPANSLSFFLVVACVLAATLVVVPSLVPYSGLQLLPGVLLLLKYRKQLWGSGRWARHAYVAALSLGIWPYAVILVLVPVRLLLFPLARRMWMWPLFPIPVFPLFIAAALVWLVALQTRASQPQPQIAAVSGE